MQPVALSAPEEAAVTRRAAALFEEQRQGVFRRTDRLFAVLLACEWLAGVSLAQ